MVRSNDAWHMCWACMQCKLTYKQKHTNYKKLTKFTDCTIDMRTPDNNLTIDSLQGHLKYILSRMQAYIADVK